MSQEIRGGKNQFQRDVVAHMSVLKPIALKLCKDKENANDLIHDTVVRAFESEHLFTPGTNLGGWLNTILRNLFITRVQREARKKQLLAAYYTPPICIQHDPDSKMELDRVLAAVKQIPKNQARAVMGLAIGRSCKEVAKSQRVELGTVKSRAARGRETLRAILDIKTTTQ